MRRTALFCALLLLFCNIPIVEAAVVYPDALQNAGFNETGGWSGTNWSYSADAYEGTGSLRLATEESTDSCYVGQRIMVLPMTQYRISAFMKADVAEIGMERGPAFKIEPSTVDGDGVVTSLNGGGCSDFFSRNTNGEWIEVSYEFETLPGCNSIGILLRLYGGRGTVYFDAVEIEKLETHRFSLETDETFYYNEAETVSAKIIWNTDVYTEKNGTIDYTLFDEAGKAKKSWSKKGLEETFTFPLASLENEGEKYKLSAKLRQGGIGVEEHAVSIYRYARPAPLDERGVYYKDGKPFYPRIGYHVSEDQYSRMQEIGVNVVQLTLSSTVSRTETDRILKLLKDNGLMALVTLYYRQVMPAYSEAGINKATHVIGRINESEYKDAVFGYALMDEPFGLFYAPDAWLEASYKLVRDLSPDAVIYTVDNMEFSLERTARYVDALAVDPYPGSNAENTENYRNHVLERVQKAVSAVNGKKAVYNVLQAFSFRSFTPTAAQITHMEYQGVCAGATGSALFALDYEMLLSALEEKEKNPVYREMQRFSTADMPLLLSMIETEEKETVTGDGYIYTAAKLADRMHILYVNTESASSGVFVTAEGDAFVPNVPIISQNQTYGEIMDCYGGLTIAENTPAALYTLYGNKKETGFHSVSDQNTNACWFYYRHTGETETGRIIIAYYKTTHHGRELLQTQIGGKQIFTRDGIYRTERMEALQSEDVYAKAFVWTENAIQPIILAVKREEI